MQNIALSLEMHLWESVAPFLHCNLRFARQDVNERGEKNKFGLCENHEPLNARQ